MIELRAAALRCELVPELGGAVAGLWLDGVPVLHSTPAAQLQSARQAGCQALVPYSNRIGQAAVVWQGTQQPLVRHPGDAPRNILGLGWQRPWEVLDADEGSVMLACEHRADSGWPFAFDCSHTSNQQTLPVIGSAPPCLQQQPFTIAGSTARFPRLQRAQAGPG